MFLKIGNNLVSWFTALLLFFFTFLNYRCQTFIDLELGKYNNWKCSLSFFIITKRLASFLQVKVSIVNSAVGSFSWNYATGTFYRNYAGANCCCNYAGFEVLLQLCQWYFLLQLRWWIFLLQWCRWLFLLQFTVRSFCSIYAGKSFCSKYVGDKFYWNYAGESVAIMQVAFSAVHYAHDYF